MATIFHLGNTRVSPLEQINALDYEYLVWLAKANIIRQNISKEALAASWWKSDFFRKSLFRR